MPTHRPACILHTMPDPDQLLVCSHAEVGGTLEVRCNSRTYPFFDVVFPTDNPSDDVTGQSFSGTNTAPAVIQLNKEGRFEYYVNHYQGQEKRHPAFPPKGPFPCNLHPCKGCL